MQKTMVAVAERDLSEEAARDLHHANDQNLLLDEKLNNSSICLRNKVSDNLYI